MRQRITFLQEPNDAIDPQTLKVTETGIEGKEIKAAREEKITFGFDELPQELYRVLKASYEVHIRWVSEEAYEGMGPLVSRLSPGLHVLYTPQRGNNNSSLLCPMLKKAFGEIDCVSPETTFTTLPIDRFSHSASSQYYSALPSLADLTTYLSHRLCKGNSHPTCQKRVSGLSSVSYLDIDFDTISHALTLTAFYPSATQPLSILSHSPTSRLEVGLLTIEVPTEPEELSLGGFLTVLGESTKPSPTLFSFPSRHHSTPQTFTSTFLLPTGLHPTLLLNITGLEPPLEDRTCNLHAHVTLPKGIFADKYQLSDPLFLSSKNLTSLHYITTPVDLEAPIYTVPEWGSSILLELSPPSDQNPKNKEQTWTSQIPLHLRYLPPSHNTSGLLPLSLPYPILFWACTADEGSKFTVNPFDRVNLGYDGLFGPRTLFYHLSPRPSSGGDGRLVNTVIVPVLDLDKSGFVEVGTATVVMLGFLWVLWCLGGVWRGVGYGSGRGSKVSGVEGEKKKL